MGKSICYTTEHGKKALNEVLNHIKEYKASYVISYINAEGCSTEFLEWVVAEWYVPAYQQGLIKIGHKLGDQYIANAAAQLVSWKDKSGIVFKNFTTETDEEMIHWLQNVNEEVDIH